MGVSGPGMVPPRAARSMKSTVRITIWWSPQILRSIISWSLQLEILYKLFYHCATFFGSALRLERERKVERERESKRSFGHQPIPLLMQSPSSSDLRSRARGISIRCDFFWCPPSESLILDRFASISFNVLDPIDLLGFYVWIPLLSFDVWNL